MTRLKAIVERLNPDLRSQSQRDINVLLRAGGTSFGNVATLAQDPAVETELRTIACWVLARCESEQAVATLLAILSDRAKEVRAAAAKSLGELGDALAVPSLVVALSADTDREVRRAAAYSLGLIGDPTALEALTNKLKDQGEDPAVRGMAAEALADLRDFRAIDTLMAALVDPSAEVRFWASFALGELGAQRALPALEHLAQTDNGVLSDIGTVKEEAAAAARRIRERT